eukprot:g25840.t1
MLGQRIAFALTGAASLGASSFLFRDLADLSQWVVKTERNDVFETFKNRHKLAATTCLASAANTAIFLRTRCVPRPAWALMNGAAAVLLYSGYVKPELMMRTRNRNALYIQAGQALDVLAKEETVIVTRLGDCVRAFPDSQAARTQVVNVGKTASGVPVVMTYCGLTNLGIVYETPPHEDGRPVELLPMTLLRNNHNLVLLDKASGHLGQQITGLDETSLFEKMKNYAKSKTRQSDFSEATQIDSENFQVSEADEEGDASEPGEVKIGEEVETGEEAEKSCKVTLGEEVETGEEAEKSYKVALGEEVETGEEAEKSYKVTLGEEVETGEEAEKSYKVNIGEEVETGEEAEKSYKVKIGEEVETRKESEKSYKAKLQRLGIPKPVEVPSWRMSLLNFARVYPQGEVFIHDYKMFKDLQAPVKTVYESVLDFIFDSAMKVQRTDTRPAFPTLANIDERLPSKELVWGLNVGEDFVAVTEAFVREAPHGLRNLTVGEAPLVVAWDPDAESLGVWKRPTDSPIAKPVDIHGRVGGKGESLERLATVKNGAYWCVWANFFPDTRLNPHS